jgi:predicted acyl esterase
MTELLAHHAREEVRGDLRVLWNVEVPTRDGTILRGDVFLPVSTDPVPVILSHGCYAKGISFQEGYSGQWARMVSDFPEIEEGSSGQYQCWEVTDPERWVQHGYAVVRVDSRGAGVSPGLQHLWSQQEVLDYYDVIEWVGTQPWSDGNVGLLGISYYAANQWRVAALQPAHLKAIVPWEGASDLYRELYFHGGIRSTFLDSWAPRQLGMQHGYGDRGLRNPVTGLPVAGDLTLSDEELEANRVDVVSQVKAHPLLDAFHADQAPDLSKVTVPVLSLANWGGQGLHLRGNVEGFGAVPAPAWLGVHGLEHWTHFYTDYGIDLQRRFLDHFLKGADNGWDEQPRVLLQVRHVDRFVQRAEAEWPLARTDWQRHFLDATEGTLRSSPGRGAAITYDPQGDGAVFVTPPSETDTELTGPVSATLHISSSTVDADLFLVLGLIDPDGNEVTFRGAMDAHTPVAQGWLRASHRALDPVRSTPHRPFHLHDRVEPLVPGAVYQVEVEIWPTSVVVPAGHRLRLNVRGRDYEYSGHVESESFHRYPSRGCGPFLHPFGEGRPEAVYGAPVTIHTGAAYPSSLLLPVVPAADQSASGA